MFTAAETVLWPAHATNGTRAFLQCYSFARMDSYQKEVAKDASRYLPAKVIPALAGLANVAVLTRLLGPAQYSSYSISVAAMVLASAAFFAWIGQALLFLYPVYEVRGDALAFRAHLARLAGLAAATTAMTLTFGILLLRRDVWLALSVGMAGCAQIGHSFAINALQARRAAGAAALSLIVQSLVQLSASCVSVAVFRLGAQAAVASVALGYGCGIAVAMAVGRLDVRLTRPDLAFQKALSRKILAYGLPLALWFLASQIMLFADRFFVDRMMTQAQAGRYDSLKDLATGSLSLITMPLLMAAQPIIMQMWARREPPERVAALVDRNVRLLLLLFSPVLLAVYVVGVDALQLIAGKAYDVSPIVATLVVASAGIAGLNMYLHKAMEVSGRTLDMAATAGAAAVATIAVAPFLIRYGELVGAAVSVCLAQVIYGAAVAWRGRKILGLSVPYSLGIRLAIWSIGLLIVCHIARECCSNSSRLNTVVQSAIVALGAAALLIASPETRALAAVLLSSYRREARDETIAKS